MIVVTGAFFLWKKVAGERGIDQLNSWLAMEIK